MNGKKVITWGLRILFASMAFFGAILYASENDLISAGLEGLEEFFWYAAMYKKASIIIVAIGLVGLINTTKFHLVKWITNMGSLILWYTWLTHEDILFGSERIAILTCEITNCNHWQSLIEPSWKLTLFAIAVSGWLMRKWFLGEKYSKKQLRYYALALAVLTGLTFARPMFIP